MAVIACKELRSIIQALARRIEDNSEVSITKKGLAIKAVVAAHGAKRQHVRSSATCCRCPVWAM